MILKNLKSLKIRDNKIDLIGNSKTGILEEILKKNLSR